MSLSTYVDRDVEKFISDEIGCFQGGMAVDIEKFISKS
jgi:hypothetical protein